jgi:hypothetical protein
MDIRELKNLGDPDLQIAGLRIWIHDRQFPEATDYWDGNWLRVTAFCVYPDSVVRAHGSIIHLREIAGLLAGCEQLYETLKGTAALACMEPNLAVELTGETGGRIGVSLSITPDNLTESHKYFDGFDQTFLPPLISSCRSILKRFPIREGEKESNA